MEPRWVDLQINGRIGISFTDAALTEEAVLKVTETLAAGGTAGYQPTICTCPDEVAIHCLKTIAAAKRKYPECAKRILGIHMEGPFFSEKKKGAQNGAYLRLPDAAAVRKLYEASQGLLRIVDVAPELEGSAAFAGEVSRYCTVSIAHTDASYEDAVQVLEAGATHMTHLYNCMPSIHHRRQWYVEPKPSRNAVRKAFHTASSPRGAPDAAAACGWRSCHHATMLAAVLAQHRSPSCSRLLSASCQPSSAVTPCTQSVAPHAACAASRAARARAREVVSNLMRP